MKLLLLFAIALGGAACDRVLFSADPTPPPATPPPATPSRIATASPKPGARMWATPPSRLDPSGGLGGHGKK